MLQFLLCLTRVHGVMEFERTADGQEIRLCRDCMKEMKSCNNLIK